MTKEFHHVYRDTDHAYDFTDRAFYDAVYTILVDHAGAPSGISAFRSRDDDREIFIRAYCAVDHPATEYRFGGRLGFGGKFWCNDGRFYVSCYREDETPKTLAVVKKVNDLIDKAVLTYKPKQR